jgi:hypothetical protein
VLITRTRAATTSARARFRDFEGTPDHLIASGTADTFEAAKAAVATSLTAFGLPVKISIHSLLEGATRATGTMAILDVYRVFTAAVALANGASAVVIVARSPQKNAANRQ